MFKEWWRMTPSITQLRLTPAFELKAAAHGEGIIEGLASPFGGPPDAYGDVIAPGAFSASLKSYRDIGAAPAFLWGHDQQRPIGLITNLDEKSDGLHIRAKLNLGTAQGREALTHVEGGSATGLSIGYQVPKGGAEDRDGQRLLKTIELHEISLVAVPAARSARIRQVKNLASQGELERLLKEAGLARRAAEKLAAGGWPALNETSETEDLAHLLKSAVAEIKEGL